MQILYKQLQTVYNNNNNNNIPAAYTYVYSIYKQPHTLYKNTVPAEYEDIQAANRRPNVMKIYLLHMQMYKQLQTMTAAGTTDHRSSHIIVLSGV